MVANDIWGTRETLLAPRRNSWRKLSPINWYTTKRAEGKKVAVGSVVVVKLGNAGGAKGPCC